VDSPEELQPVGLRRRRIFHERSRVRSTKNNRDPRHCNARRRLPGLGAACAETSNETDPTLLVQPRNTKGSTENVPLLEAGTLDTGQVTGEVTYEPIEGIGRRQTRSLPRRVWISFIRALYIGLVK
jgi:hypothetical protein